MANVAFIGLGVMGYPMAGHLLNAGHDVRVYNRTEAKAQQWVAQFGGTSWATPASAAENADFIFCCVGNDDDVRDVILGEQGVCQTVSSGAIVIDCTTTSATLAQEVAETLALKQVGFLDAPVSGGQAGAELGCLTVMVGGDKVVFARALPIIKAFAQACQLMGPIGCGQLTKMVNQICIAGVVQGLAEGLNFARYAGLDGKQVAEVIGKGAAQSWQLDNRARTMWNGEYDFGFAIDWMRKDLGIALAEARSNGAQLPLTALVDQFYAEMQHRGYNRADTSCLMARCERPKN